MPSIGELTDDELQANYIATKSFILPFLSSIASQLAERGVKSGKIHPHKGGFGASIYCSINSTYILCSLTFGFPEEPSSMHVPFTIKNWGIGSMPWQYLLRSSPTKQQQDETLIQFSETLRTILSEDARLECIHWRPKDDSPA